MSYRVTAGSSDGVPTISLCSAADELTAVFAPSVGMIGCSLRHRDQELLGLRKGLRAYAETGSSMGIPLLHPWANRLSKCAYRIEGKTLRFDGESDRVRRDPNGLPIHGLLTAHGGWQVVERSANQDGARLVARLNFAAQSELVALFPFPHELVQEVCLADGLLSIRTVLRATGDVPVPVSFGYHPYFTLPGVQREQWHVELPVRTRMKLDERFLPTGETEAVNFAPGPLGDRQFDDLFCELAPDPVFRLAGGGRRISVSFDESYPIAVIFAPRGESFICFEPMTAPTNALVSGWPGLRLVQPGAELRARFGIRVDAL